MLEAFVLWVLAQVEVWGFWDSDQGSQAVAAVAVTLMAIALVSVAWTAIGAQGGPLWPFVMTLVATYTVAEQTPRMPVAAAGLACGLAGPWVEITVEGPDIANYAFTGVLIVGAWIAGRGM